MKKRTLKDLQQENLGSVAGALVALLIGSIIIVSREIEYKYGCVFILMVFLAYIMATQVEIYNYIKHEKTQIKNKH